MMVTHILYKPKIEYKKKKKKNYLFSWLNYDDFLIFNFDNIRYSAIIKSNIFPSLIYFLIVYLLIMIKRLLQEFDELEW
jgi:hypothetical protein